MLAHRQNTVFLCYRLLEGDGPVPLKLRPQVHFRAHEDPVNKPLADAYSLTVINGTASYRFRARSFRRCDSAFSPKKGRLRFRAGRSSR